MHGTKADLPHNGTTTITSTITTAQTKNLFEVCILPSQDQNVFGFPGGTLACRLFLRRADLIAELLHAGIEILHTPDLDDLAVLEAEDVAVASDGEAVIFLIGAFINFVECNQIVLFQDQFDVDLQVGPKRKSDSRAEYA